ncbi:STAS domain-containing protein [Anaerolineales bacterium HSG25]|nr:STAS domain-containing protein [Anaerolineales bacterium HSG25]
MKIEISEHIIRIYIITLDGRVDAFHVPKLRETLQAYQDKGATNFVIDLSAVLFMDSAGMATLVSLLKYARTVMGDVKLVWPTNFEAQRILKLTRFDRVFEMVNDSSEGVYRFTHPS